MRAAKCERTDFGIYKADELRRLAQIYNLNEHSTEKPIELGGSMSCGFDDLEAEKCAWYPVPLGGADGHLKRARFESFFELEKFDCTSDRTFNSLGLLLFLINNNFR